MSANTAMKCFEDNFARFGDSRTDPERFNNYKGLTHLASVIEDVQQACTVILENQKKLDNRLVAIERRLTSQTV
ncbi:MAG: hypothetical protein R3B46_01895 [Phycisphaerales bacterium]|nr:hypothetical protein [Phycisphaerales bacterium]